MNQVCGFYDEPEHCPEFGNCGDCSHYMLKEHDKQIRLYTINEFVKKCKVTHDGLICNWDKPYGITFEKMEEKAKEYQ